MVLQEKGMDRPGNLVGSGPFLFSVGPREIVAYPRAEVLLNDVKQRLGGGDGAANDLLLAADLKLDAGRIPRCESLPGPIAPDGTAGGPRGRKRRI